MRQTSCTGDTFVWITNQADHIIYCPACSGPIHPDEEHRSTPSVLPPRRSTRGMVKKRSGG